VPIIKRYSVDEKTGIVAEIPDWWLGSDPAPTRPNIQETEQETPGPNMITRKLTAEQSPVQSVGDGQSDLRRKLAIKLASQLVQRLHYSEDTSNLLFDALTDGLLTRTDDELLSLIEEM
jgi:hypothetical protein